MACQGITPSVPMRLLRHFWPALFLIPFLCAGCAKKTQEFGGHSESVLDMAFTSDGKYLVTGSADHSVQLWEVKTGRAIRKYLGHSGAVTSIAITPDDHLILSGSVDNTLRLWNLNSGLEIRRFDGHTDQIHDVDISRNGRFAVSASRDLTVRRWDMRTGEELQCFSGHESYVTSVAFSPAGSKVLSGGFDEIFLWDIKTAAVEVRIEDILVEPEVLAFLPDGRHILAGTCGIVAPWKPQSIQVWDLSTGNQIHYFGGRMSWAKDLSLSPDGKRVICAVDSGRTIVWDLATESRICTIRAKHAPVTCVVFAPDGRSVAIAESDNSIGIWDLPN